MVRHLPLPLDEGQREAGDDDDHRRETHDEQDPVHSNRRRRAVFLGRRRAGRERDEGRGQKARREHADQQSEDGGARLRDEVALDVERRDGLDVEIHHGEEARRRRHLDQRPLAQQTQALEQGRRAAPAPDERADPEHERVLEEGPEPDEEPDPQPVGELALAAGAEVIFLFEELGLDRVGHGLGHEALELAHRARIKQELVLVLEDALAEEDRDGDGDGREAARDGARVDGALLALLGGGRGDGRGDREEDVRAREAPRRRRAVVVVVRRGRRRRGVERRRIEQRLVEERVVRRGRGREAPPEAGAAGAGAAEVPLHHGAGRGREAGAGEARAGRQARRVVLGQRRRGRGQREEHRRHCHRRVAAPCLVESTTRHSIEAGLARCRPGFPDSIHASGRRLICTPMPRESEPCVRVNPFLHNFAV